MSRKYLFVNTETIAGDRNNEYYYKRVDQPNEPFRVVIVSID